MKNFNALQAISKAALFLAVLFLFFVLIEQKINQAKIRTLNYFMPHSYAALLDENAGPPEKDLRHAVFYYQLISSIVPTNADADAMLGFCYSRLGQETQARKFFTKAAALNSKSFWVYYDLGLLYFKEDDLTRSALALTQALKIPPQTAFEALYSSKIYMDITQTEKIDPARVINDLKTGYQQAFKLMRLNALAAQQRTSIENIRELINPIHVQVL